MKKRSDRVQAARGSEAGASGLLKVADIRPSMARLRIAACLLHMQAGRHLTVCELHREMLRDGASVSLSTVYAAIRVFVERGLVEPVCEGTYVVGASLVQMASREQGLDAPSGTAGDPLADPVSEPMPL